MLSREKSYQKIHWKAKYKPIQALFTNTYQIELNYSMLEKIKRNWKYREILISELSM